VKTSPGRPLLRAAAVVMIAAMGVTACTSNPSAKRVAEDLINTLAETDEERVCMLEKVDAYSKDELEEIGKDAESGDGATKAAANAELDKLQAELESCLA
jgi:hypothetical protein